MHTIFRHAAGVALVTALALLLPDEARSQAATDDPVLVENSTVTIRRSDYQRELERLPPEVRPGFANSEKRVNELLRRMLIERTLAAQARAEKLETRPENAARFAMEQERLYAQLKVAEIDALASAGFDARRAQWEARAREIYQVDRAKYSTPEQVSASHILFDTKTRTSDEARRLAAEALAKVKAGADFNVLAREVSDDRSAKSNSGQLGWFSVRRDGPGVRQGRVRAREDRRALATGAVVVRLARDPARRAATCGPASPSRKCASRSSRS